MTTTTDKDVLVTLYECTQGDGWHRRDNWSSREPINRWAGVTAANDRVVALDLRKNNLTGPIPPEIGRLSGLRDLRLNRNRLTGTIPPQIGELGQLTRLGLGRNRLTGRLPAAIGNLERLQKMGLAGNDLEGPIPTEFGNLACLESLFMGSNQGLEGALPATFGNLSCLKDLYVDNNRMAGSLPPELAGLQNVKRFWFSNTRMCAPSSTEFQKWLRGIREARSSGLTSGTETDRKALEAIYRVTGGEGWHRREGWLTEVPLERWAGVDTDSRGRVVKLSLQGNGLTGIFPPEIANLTELEDLFVESNPGLKGSLPLAMTALRSVKALKLGGTGLCAPLDEFFQDWLKTKEVAAS